MRVSAFIVLTASCAGCTGAAPSPADPPNPAAAASAPTEASASATTASATQAPTAEPAAAPPSPYVPCEAAPVGMACIPGGPAVIGSDDHHPEEKPQHSVELSTFYIDRTEVSNAQYEACEKARGCRKSRHIAPAWKKTFLAPDQPAIAVTWQHAHDYCAWAGKRLPTEAEWEKVARGGPEGWRYPWGDSPPSCQRAHTAGCTPNATRPVGSLPAGAYGVHDMAGNGYEWVNDWHTPCYGDCGLECGDACLGLDPQGPCGGSSTCPAYKMRAVKGGAWLWPAEQARGSSRRRHLPPDFHLRFSFRCATSRPTLTTWPPLAVTDPLPAPPDLQPPSAAELATLRDVVEDEDISKIPLCRPNVGAEVDCREPFSYVTTNEPGQYLWVPYIQNVGGGYVGIGADQNYSFIATARSRWAWLFDYDETVVRLHYVIRAVVLDSPTPRDFVAAFGAMRHQRTAELVRASLADRPAERDEVERVLRIIRPMVVKYYQAALKPVPHLPGYPPARATFGWLRNAQHYTYVRMMFQQGRIHLMKGNLLTDRAMPSIAAAARKLQVPMRILYVSNADDQWRITPQYRSNIAGLPFDERSVVLRTLYPRARRRSGGGDPWDYLITAGLEEQRLMVHEGWLFTRWFAAEARRVKPRWLKPVALPGRTEREAAPATAAARSVP